MAGSMAIRSATASAPASPKSRPPAGREPWRRQELRPLRRRPLAQDRAQHGVDQAAKRLGRQAHRGIDGGEGRCVEPEGLGEAQPQKVARWRRRFAAQSRIDGPVYRTQPAQRGHDHGPGETPILGRKGEIAIRAQRLVHAAATRQGGLQQGQGRLAGDKGGVGVHGLPPCPVPDAGARATDDGFLTKEASPMNRRRLLLTAALTLAALPGALNAQTPPRGFTPILLEKLLKLIAALGVDTSVPAPVASALGLSSDGQPWPVRQFAVQSTAEGTLHAVAIHRGEQLDLVFSTRGPAAISIFRTHRDGVLVTATDYFSQTHLTASPPLTQSQTDFAAEATFWSVHVDDLLSQAP